MPESATPVMPGRHVRPHEYGPDDIIGDKYRLLSVLGEGGMGEVWLARNLDLEVDVAIKLIRADVSGPETTRRLMQEARAVARLGHPAIVRVHDLGRTSYGDPFLVMELLQGEPLDEVLDSKGCLPAVNAVQLLLPIVSGLAAAHEEGIVHRDLKPENIFLATRGDDVTPKLVDFGVAKVVEDTESIPPASSPNLTSITRRLTQLGVLIGSPAYMSPEQASAGEIDHRSDLWALSVVLYEVINGSPPFDYEAVPELLVAILSKDPKPLDQHPALWPIIERGLAKEARERWGSAREMGQALAGWLVSQGVDTDVVGTSLQQEWLGDRPSRPLTQLPASRGTLPSFSVTHEVVHAQRREDPPAPASTDGLEDVATSRRRRWIVTGAVALLMVAGLIGVALRAQQGAESSPDAAEDRDRSDVVSPVNRPSPELESPVVSDVAPGEPERAAETAPAREESAPSPPPVAGPVGPAPAEPKPLAPKSPVLDDDPGF